ncbi:MAG: hypothetical protein R3E77_12345 [Steroidobacteraceae bacterium]
MSGSGRSEVPPKAQPELAPPPLHCTRCRRGGLRMRNEGLICEACGSGFPMLGGIPWLFAEPQAALSEWQARLRLLLADIERRSHAARIAGENAVAGSATARRLQLLADAQLAHARQLLALLEPLQLTQQTAAYETLLALRTQLPADQGLTNYYANLHRDWCWGDAENRAAIDIVSRGLGNCLEDRDVLVLGAGAGRLAYDLHQALNPRYTLALDFNPMLLFVAREMFAGRELELMEFPIAPSSIQNHAVTQRLRSPAESRAGLHAIAGDALRPPVAPGSMGAVVTPWLVDVVGERLSDFATRVNHLLADDAVWINFGSLTYTAGPLAERISLEEAREILGAKGFEIERCDEDEIDYMRSPLSRHARRERAVSWLARKRATAGEPVEHSHAPPWLVDATLPVPYGEELRHIVVATRVQAHLMSLIDGRRSLRDMAQLLTEQRLLGAQEAESAVRRFLQRLHDDARQQ